MTDPIRPATDEMIERLRPHFPDPTKDVVPQLIARIDAERAARERAEARLRSVRATIASAFNVPPPDELEIEDVALAILQERVWVAAALTAKDVTPPHNRPSIILSQRQFEELCSIATNASLESRARAIRAVVAAQWGVACMLEMNRRAESHAIRVMKATGFSEHYAAGLEDAVRSAFQCLAALPTAEQIVDGAV